MELIKNLLNNHLDFVNYFCDALEDFTLRILIVANCIIVIEVGTADADHRSTVLDRGSSSTYRCSYSATVTSVNDYQK